MTIGRVTGPVVLAAGIKALEGYKLLGVQPVTPEGEPSGKPVIAVDTVKAGKGDYVFLIDEGGSAGIILGLEGAPIRTVIAGIIDQISEVK